MVMVWYGDDGGDDDGGCDVEVAWYSKRTVQYCTLPIFLRTNEVDIEYRIFMGSTPIDMSTVNMHTYVQYVSLTACKLRESCITVNCSEYFYPH